MRHSQWIMIGGLVFREGEHHPDMRLFLVPMSEVKPARHLVLRRAARLPARTPSALDDVFVPEHRSVSFSTLRDAHARRDR